jgi:hypothetical protein
MIEFNAKEFNDCGATQHTETRVGTKTFLEDQLEGQ